jgi:hypothetical protein
MKQIVLKTYGKMLALLMSFFGFIIGCDKWIDPVAEYGVPSADFKVKGTVKSAHTGNPIPNIRIIVKEPFERNADTAFTDAGGNYSLEINQIIGFPVKIHAHDVDGEANGSFNPDSIVVDWDNVSRIKKGKGWYKGMYEKNDADFILKSPVAMPMYGVPAATYRKLDEK